MARLSQFIKLEKQRKNVEKHLKLRKQLREKVKNLDLPDDERAEAQRKLQSLPRISSEIRVRNRCMLTGRSRGYLRDFGISRIKFRELAHRGMIPGVTKASW